MQHSNHSPCGGQYVSVDRFEGDVAVLAVPDAASKTGEAFVNTPRTALPQGTKEGDWLVVQPDGSYQIDAALTQQRRAAAKARVQALLNRRL